MLNTIFHLTVSFILTIFTVIVVYDIIAVIYQTLKGTDNKLGLITISRVLRRWYDTKPITPFLFAVIFIGHIGISRWINFFPATANLIIFLVLAITSLTWFIIEMVRRKQGKPNNKFYNVLCRFWPISMIFGSVVGMWWQVH